MIKVQTAPGRRVQLPGGKWVPEAGISVEETSFIRRRVNAGDLVIVPPAAVDAAPAAEVEPAAESAGSTATAAAVDVAGTGASTAAQPAVKQPVPPVGSNEADQGARPLKGN
jgi:hypothetical protein